MPGCEREWRWSKTLRRNWAGTTDRKVPVDISQVSRLTEPGREMSLSSSQVDVALTYCTALPQAGQEEGPASPWHTP